MDNKIDLDLFQKSKQTISTTIPTRLWLEAQKYKIAWNEALILGVEIKLAEKGLAEYSPQIKLTNTIVDLNKKLAEVSEKLAVLEKEKENRSLNDAEVGAGGKDL